MKLKPDEFKFFDNCIRPFFKNKYILKMDAYVQHGQTSCLRHSLAVAYYSYAICMRLGLKCRAAALIRGAMLHDFFLYDWHIPNKSHRLHGFKHPKTALINAEKHFKLSDTEREVIIKHMWPLTLRVPMCREALIVCIVDKICTIAEMFERRKYRIYTSLSALSYLNKNPAA